MTWSQGRVGPRYTEGARTKEVPRNTRVAVWDTLGRTVELGVRGWGPTEALRAVCTVPATIILLSPGVFTGLAGLCLAMSRSSRQCCSSTTEITRSLLKPWEALGLSSCTSGSAQHCMRGHSYLCHGLHKRASFHVSHEAICTGALAPQWRCLHHPCRVLHGRESFWSRCPFRKTFPITPWPKMKTHF